MEVIDPSNNEKIFKNYKGKNLENLFSEDVTLIEQYINDMQIGSNVSGNTKGKRSYARLNALRSRIPRIALWIKEKYNKRITELTPKEVVLLFDDLKTGVIKSDLGKQYKSYDDYVKDFKAFWNWYVKKKRREDKVIIENIMYDVEDEKGSKPKWVYLTGEDYIKLLNNVSFDYKVIIQFLMDSGIRSPKEMMNVRVSDLHKDNNNLFLNIREETSKTIGRKIKLMNCRDLLLEYINQNGLKGDDLIFTKNPIAVNNYLKRKGQKIFGNGNTKGGKPYSRLTLYDFRHNSACYWLPKYTRESGIMYRFGWKKRKMIEYYTEFLGFKDTITEEDLLDPVSKTQLERELEIKDKKIQLLEDEVKSMSKDLDLIKQLLSKPNIKNVIEQEI